MKLRNVNKNGIAATRELLGLSQSQFAELLGISKSGLAMAETGRRGLPAAVLLKIARLEIKLSAAGITTETGKPARDSN